MIGGMAGPFCGGTLTLLMGIVFLREYVHRGFINTGRWGLFVPVTGVQAILVIFMLVVFGVLYFLYCGYILACLAVFSKRGDFAQLPEKRPRDITEPASTAFVFMVMLAAAITITVVFLLVARPFV